MVRPKIIFPEQGLNQEEVLNLLEESRKDDINWREGRVWSLVYHASDEHKKLMEKASSMFISMNALSPMAFPSLLKFETEVVSMALDLFHADRKACGSLTSGGTESILMAIKTYREWARDKMPGIKEPEMILPSSAHPAFLKGAEYFDVVPVIIPVDKETHRADVDAMKNVITNNTIMMVASACDFPRGVVDPISELGVIAKERKIGLHVDSCLGGFMLPFVKELGYHVPDFDFSVPGVTSMSADLHKYGYAAKGASVILYRRDNLWKYQFSVFTDWTGGIYLSPSMRGTRPGGPIAAAWASLKALGKDGYLKTAKIVMNTSKQIMNEIEQIPELYIIGKPVMSVFSFASDTISMYQLGEVMDTKGWHLDRIQYPEALHIMVNPHHAEIVETFLKDLRESVDSVVKNPKKDEGAAAMYGMVATLPDRTKVRDYVINFLKSQYKI